MALGTVMAKGRAFVHWLFHPGDRLSQRVIHAGFWAFALRITDRLFGLARTIVLARLLSPNDFGLFGIALLGLSALNTFSQTGFQQALIQKKGDIKPYLDTAWTVHVIRGFALAGILFVIAPYVATFFGEPRAVGLLRVLGLSAIFQGLTNIGVVYFQKELEFHKRFIYMFSGTLADLGVAIPAALILRNAWALVFGLLAGNFVRMVVSYLIHAYKPMLHLNKRKCRELYRFGKWILANNVVLFLATFGGDIYLGKVLGLTALGLYQMAFRISNLAATEFAKTLSLVMFPTYAKIQHEISALKKAFLETLQITLFVSLPFAVLIWILATDFVPLFLGEAWVPMVPTLRLLTILVILRPLIGSGGALFRAIGRPQIDFWVNFTRVGVVGATLYPLTALYGINGVATAIIISYAAATLIWWIASFRILRWVNKELLRKLYSTIVGVGALVIVVIFLKQCVYFNSLHVFLGILIIGVSVYLAVQLCFEKHGYETPLHRFSRVVHDGSYNTKQGDQIK